MRYSRWQEIKWTVADWNHDHASDILFWRCVAIYALLWALVNF